MRRWLENHPSIMTALQTVGVFLLIFFGSLVTTFLLVRIL